MFTIKTISGSSIDIAELSPNISVFFGILLLFLPIAAVMYGRNKEDITFQEFFKISPKNVFGFVYFFLPNQARFIYDYGLFLLVDYIRFVPKKNDLPKYVIVPFIAFLIINQSLIREPEEFLKELNFIKDSNILTTTKESFLITHLYKNNNKFMPPMEMNYMYDNNKILYKDIILKGKLDCQRLISSKTDYLIENKLKKAGSCVELVGIFRDIRVWRVKKIKN